MVKHYYNEMAQIANALIELGFECDSSAYSDFNKQEIQVSVHTDYIVLRNTIRSQRYCYGNFSVDKIIERIKELLSKPHWEVDGVDLKHGLGNRTINDMEYYFFTDVNKDIFNNYSEYQPKQLIGKESDFTILYKDGSVKYAKYVK